MLQNRSVPPGAVIPFLYYNSVPHAIEWLCGAFGFTERLRTPAEYDGSIHLAQLNVGKGSVMLRTRPASEESSDDEGTPLPHSVQSLLVRIENIDAHCEHAREFGAHILSEPKDTEFGERQYTAEDQAGNRWTFSQSIADVNPADWGAEIGDLS